MTENKRYNIKPSKIIENGFCIQDDERKHSFPTVDDKSNLIMYEKALNEQDNRIKELEQENKIHLREGMWLLRFLKAKGFTEDDVIKFKEHIQKQNR